MVYNISGFQNSTTIGEVMIFTNNTVNGLLFGGFMIGLFIVLMMLLKKFAFDEALLSSSFACFVLSSLLAYGGFLNILFPLGFLVIMGFTGLIMYSAG